MPKPHRGHGRVLSKGMRKYIRREKARERRNAVKQNMVKIKKRVRGEKRVTSGPALRILASPHRPAWVPPPPPESPPSPPRPPRSHY